MSKISLPPGKEPSAPPLETVEHFLFPLGGRESARTYHKGRKDCRRHGRKPAGFEHTASNSELALSAGRDGLRSPVSYSKEFEGERTSLVGWGKRDWSRNLRLECGCENYSFAPLGLVCFPFFARLAPWAVFLRRFSAKTALHRVSPNSSPEGFASGAEARIYFSRFAARVNSCPLPNLDAGVKLMPFRVRGLGCGAATEAGKKLCSLGTSNASG